MRPEPQYLRQWRMWKSNGGISMYLRQWVRSGFNGQNMQWHQWVWTGGFLV